MKRSVRVTRTASGAQAVQVVEYWDRQVHICKHIGSAHTAADVRRLRDAARAWMLTHPPQAQLFATPTEASGFLLREYEYRGVHCRYAYELLYRLSERLGFVALRDVILTDLVIMRVFEPASKRRSLTLLAHYFGIEHTEQTLYRHLRRWPRLKSAVEARLVAVAKREFKFDFSFVLYDVTTLYFETVRTDALRQPGFSKDSKSQQSQIVIGLMVTPEGFPVSYEIFAGNTFEGVTFVPSILAFKALHQIETLTVVADAAMLSLANMQALAAHGLTYIVGARLGNISADLLATIDTGLERTNLQTMRTATLHGDLILGFSQARHVKDLRDLTKQIAKAQRQVEKPGMMRRARFVSVAGGKPSLNEALIATRRKLLGVKGYYTNLQNVSDAAIIAHYHDLWKVEQAFRIAKSDVVARPIFHRKADSIKAHLLICVMALAISKYIEIKTTRSIRAVLDACRRITDATLQHRATGEIVTMRSPVSAELAEITRRLSY